MHIRMHFYTFMCIILRKLKCNERSLGSRGGGQTFLRSEYSAQQTTQYEVI